jgi:dCMP deaminase
MRTQYLSWDEMFFFIAFASAMRSKDPSTQCGACIVKDNRPIGVGYNGLIKGLKDSPEIWEKETKKKYIMHAERNAIINSRMSDFSNCHLYIWTSNPKVYLPCDECARTIVQWGIPNVHVLKYPESIDPNTDTRWNSWLALELFNAGGVAVISHDGREINRKLLDQSQIKLHVLSTSSFSTSTAS